MSRAGGRLAAAGAIVVCLLVPWCGSLTGCGNAAAPAPQDDTYDRLRKVYNLYRAYVDKNQKGPTSEDALREFGKGLTPQERAERSIGDDLDSIFVSPRDKEKFVVQYNLKPNPAKPQALAWEATGKNGMHCVVLTMGYPAEYDEKTLNEAKK
jgi:hypothetical protein